jgi:4'-phosphopantetheinyl transferase
MRGATTRQPDGGSSISDWAAGLAQPRLAPGDVHVWRVDLDAVADDVLALLSDTERARVRRLARAPGTQRWGHSRGVLRALLGRYLRTDPGGLRLASDPAGRPYLEDHPGEGAGHDLLPAQLSFNVSHSVQTGLYAFTLVGPVGVDVELARRPIDAVALAERAFGPAEASRLRQLDAASRSQEFLRAWVRHEATLKCLGVGLGAAQNARGAAAPWIAELDVGPDAAAAVAVSGSPREVLCWEWSE